MTRWLVHAGQLSAASAFAGAGWLRLVDTTRSVSGAGFRSCGSGWPDRHPDPPATGCLDGHRRHPWPLGCRHAGLLRNPLADPGLLGVSAGASLGAVIAIYFGFAASFTLAAPLFGLTGAFVTTGIAFILARGGGTLSLILAGAAVSSIASAGVSLALNLSPNPYAAYEIMTWLMGSLADRSWDHVRLATLYPCRGTMLLLTGRALDALALVKRRLKPGDCGFTNAHAGADRYGPWRRRRNRRIRNDRFRRPDVPHLVRPLVAHRPGKVLIPAMLVGAVLVTLADIASRTLVFRACR